MISVSQCLLPISVFSAAGPLLLTDYSPYSLARLTK